MPSIVIDMYGGINLLYVRKLDGIAAPNVQVRYARWPSFTSLQNGDHATVSSFTPDFNAVVGSNDYQMMCAAGCRLYAAYASKETGTWDVYVRLITLPSPDPGCLCMCSLWDTDGDSIASLNDLTTYLAARATGAPLADVNRDHTIDTGDDVDFMTALSRALAP